MLLSFSYVKLNEESLGFLLLVGANRSNLKTSLRALGNCDCEHLTQAIDKKKFKKRLAD